MIESLHSPHIARVKALIGSRGVKERRDAGLFVAEGLQSVREALTSSNSPKISKLYLTNEGQLKLSEYDLNEVDVFEVTDAVMSEMSSTVTPQGVLALCTVPRRELSELSEIAHKQASRVIYLHEIQDPGNAGTILRTADAFGIDAVITSAGSVDMYSPKVVRSTAGSLWHIPLFEGLTFTQVQSALPQSQAVILSSHASKSILELSKKNSYISIFGNEARGVEISALGVEESSINSVTIPMGGRAESLNLSAAASIAIFTLSSTVAG
jgi:TrmH family RNA methyltransferase